MITNQVFEILQLSWLPYNNAQNIYTKYTQKYHLLYENFSNEYEILNINSLKIPLGNDMTDF